MPPRNDRAITPLARDLAARIAGSGPISLYDFIEACLYDPVHGYYRSRAAIGKDGDFITAPELSQMFGEIIGLWAAEVWHQMGEPETVRLVELGPGRGTLMADALRALKVAPAFLKRATAHLIETSKPLGEAQRAALFSAPLPVSWHEDLKDVPGGPLILIANEFFDCLPVRQFVFDAAASGWRERRVAFDDGAFRFAPGPLETNAPETGFPADAGIENGAIVEERPASAALIGSISRRSPAAALIIDYGYSRPSLGDTVQAVRGHRFVDLFDAPGESDITAHVDFGALKQAAARSTMKAFGPVPISL